MNEQEMENIVVEVVCFIEEKHSSLEQINSISQSRQQYYVMNLSLSEKCTFNSYLYE